MKRWFSVLFLSVLLAPSSLVGCKCTPKVQEIVILSTNDIHSNLDNFPRLVSAVKACRDTTDCILVDAGDRWTGNAFVDYAPQARRPIVDLMNTLHYDAATFGNHEFDSIPSFLKTMMDHYNFRVVCANIRSTDGEFPEVAPYTILRHHGVKIGIAGVVTNYQNNHPEGKDRSFVGLEFSDPVQTAIEVSKELRPKCDVMVLLSHIGEIPDTELANRPDNTYNIIIGGHSHSLLNTVIGNTTIGQTKKNLAYIGATTIRMRGRKIESIDYKNIPLTDYQPDEECQREVDKITSDPYLNEVVGYNTAALDKTGLADLHTTIIRDVVDAEVSFYHNGGIRLSNLAAGNVTRADLINTDIFYSHIFTMDMTPEQMRRMIITKFNGTNENESGQLDLFSTVEYRIVVDNDNNKHAVDVVFPTLEEGRKYRTALCNYIVDTYDDVDGENRVYYGEKGIPDYFMEYFEQHTPVTFSNEPRQRVVTQSEEQALHSQKSAA